MKAITKIMAGATGLAAIVASAPAAAQYGGYPGYGSYPGYGYGYGNNPVGSILDSILGGRSYHQNERYAVEQCVRAVEYRINTRGLDNEGDRYRNYGYGYGYNNGYANGCAGARVISVTQVSPRSNGGLKVYGLASTGMGRPYGNYNNGHPGYGYDRQGYGNYGYNGVADAQFDCSIDRYGRITDIDAKRSYAGAYPYRRY